DPGGRFFVDTDDSGQVLNHCSFLAGKPVLCAGELGVRRGRLEYIDTGSGHYRPTTHNLLKALQKLHEERVSLAGVLLRPIDGPWPNAVYDAAQFLARRGATRPVGHMAHDYRTAVRFASPAEFGRWAEAQGGPS